MFERLKENLKLEKKIVADMISIKDGMSEGGDNSIYTSSLGKLKDQLLVLNDMVPELMKEWTATENNDSKSKTKKELRKAKKKMKNKIDKNKSVEVAGEEKKENLVSVNDSAKIKSEKDGKNNFSKDEKKKSKIETIDVSKITGKDDEKNYITIDKKDRKEFLKNLKLNENSIKNVGEKKAEESVEILNKPSEYVKISNKFFRDLSDKLSPQFADLKKDLKKSNSKYLLSSYVSMMIMSTVLAFFGGLLLSIFIFILKQNPIYFAIPFGAAGITLLLFYTSPASDAKNVQKKISQELPFVAIHMSAIAGSNIEPVKIFKIISKTSEYPNVAKEFRKIVAQIELYGYDLVVSLKNVAERTSNKDLAELFSGLASNISSGGELKNYLDKKAENFLTDYRLEREKYTQMAGTFMDVYISILIAAPLIMMMMFIVMNVAGLDIGGFSINSLMIMAIFAISIANVIFLFVLNSRQPSV